MAPLLATALGWGLPILDGLAASPSAEPVYPVRGNGIAASFVPALLVVGLLALVAVWVSRRPRR